MLRFEWSEEKARRNLAKHGILFEEAKLVFQDARRIDRIDDSMDYGEERMIVIGMAKGRLLHVVYVERQRAIRLISARTTERAETDDYYTA